jgi:LPXTG-motif cell wall-anchored protein
MSPRKILVGTVLTAAALYGGTAAAADYPPSAPPTTVLASSSQSDAQPDRPAPAGQLPSTGNSDTATILEIGGVALLAGAGLVVVAKRRRRVAPT